jgi:hypothetical protein
MFKITLKIFGSKLNFINKSCRVRFQEYNKIGLVIFGFFYKSLSIYKLRAFANNTKRETCREALGFLHMGP